MPDGFQLLDTTGLAMQRTLEHVSRLSTEEAGSNTGNPVFVWTFSELWRPNQCLRVATQERPLESMFDRARAPLLPQPPIQYLASHMLRARPPNGQHRPTAWKDEA